MPAPAATTSPGRRPARRRNGATASAGCAAPSCAPPIAALLAPYLDAVAAFNPGRRAQDLSRLAGARAALLRRQDRLIACELEPHAAAALAAQLARRPPRQGDRDRRLDRAHRLRAAERAARRRADRSAVRAAGRIRPPGAGAWRRRTANGRPASTCSGTRSRTRAEAAGLRAQASHGSASRRCCALELMLPTRRTGHGLARQRADRGQPALDPARRARRAAAGARRGHVARSGRRRRRLDWLDRRNPRPDAVLRLSTRTALVST